MKNTITRISLASAAALTLLLMSACGSSPSQSGETGESSSESGTDGSGAACDTVSFWQNQFQPEDNAWFKEAVDKYNASQDQIKVELTVVPGDAWEQKLKAAQAAGSAPDMYTMNYSAVPMNARNGALAPITEYISEDSWADLDTRFLDAVTVGDSQFAYPLYYEPSALYMYRTDLFEKAGLGPDSVPTTYDELIETGRTLKDELPGVVPYQMAQNATELAWSTWGAQQGNAGHLPISEDWSEALANDPAYLPLFDLLQTMYSDGTLAKQALSAYGDLTPLAEGKLASMTTGSWALNQLLVDYPDQVKNIAVTPMATVDGDPARTTATLGGWTVGVDSKSECVAEAAEAIGYMLGGDPSLAKDYFVKTKYTKLSPRTSVSEDLADDPERSENPFYDVLAGSTKTAILEPTYDWQVSMAFGTALEKAMFGEDSVNAQNQAQTEIERLIKDLDLPATR
ncbi:extracellular solute-binding protein [Actinomycetaceae bacterium MB13-C1-2]|nr:extracellular solute-binding protein [Actinomycetaceae bacterium MB13-C1-2]